MDTFQSLKVHHHPKVWHRQNLSWMTILRKKKKCRRTKTKRDGREKTKTRERRCEIAAKNKELKQIKKAEKDKKDGREMWARLKESNDNFAKMKE